jgi:hypothetical protein
VPRAVSDSIVCERFGDPQLLADADVVLCPAVSPAVEEVSRTLGDGSRLVLLVTDQTGLDLAIAEPTHEVIAMSGWLARAARVAQGSMTAVSSSGRRWYVSGRRGQIRR